MKIWEYKVETTTNLVLDLTLNRLGKEGWELINVDSKETKGVRECIFKREKL